MAKLFFGMGAVFSVLLAAASIGHSECEGDINCNGVVDGSDLALFAGDFGITGCGSCDDVLGRMEELEERIALLEERLQHFSRNGNDIFIDGANLHVRSGEGATDDPVNGLGNLIIGYNELRSLGNNRSGSHNLVVGKQNNYESFGGLVVGYKNEISGEYASVSGGTDNTVSGDYASIGGGRGNRATALGASVSGGGDNEASSDYASVSGGYSNTAYSSWASVSGGAYNEAGYIASVSGGWENKATGHTSSVTGGRNNIASGVCAFVGGGGGTTLSDANRAFADFSSILGGWRNTAGDPNLENHALGTQSVVSAGSANVASGDRSAVSGGYNNSATAAGASVSGGRLNIANALGASVGGGDGTLVSDSFDWAAGDLYEAD